MTMQRLPDEGDLKGAAEGLLRLQRTYNISVKNVTTGNILGHHASKYLTEEDSYHLGKVAAENGDLKLSLQWLHRAKTLNKEKDFDLLISYELGNTQIEVRTQIINNIIIVLN